VRSTRKYTATVRTDGTSILLVLPRDDINVLGKAVIIAKPIEIEIKTNSVLSNVYLLPK
jgi:hypothetical protein